MEAGLPNIEGTYAPVLYGSAGGGYWIGNEYNTGALSEALTKQGSTELLGIKFTPADVNKLYAMIKEQSVYETNYTPNT